MPSTGEISELIKVLGGLPIVSLALIVIGIAIVAIVAYQFFNRGIVNTLAKIIQSQQGEIQDLQAQNTDTRDELKRSVDALVRISNGLQSDVTIIKDQGAQSAEKLDNVNGAIGQVDEKIDHIVASVDRLTRFNDDTQIAVTLQSVKDELANLKVAVSDLRAEVEKRRTNTKPIPIVTDEQLKAS